MIVFGNVTDKQSGRMNSNKLAIFKDGEAILTMSNAEAKEIAKLMSEWYGLGSIGAFTDDELCEELGDRGYSGKLKLEREVEI